MKQLTAFLLMVLCGHSVYSQTIAAARLQPVNTVVTVTGIVTNGGELGIIRYLEDGTAGIAAYGPSLGSVNRGDTITVTGTLKNYNNLLEIDPVASFTVNSTANPLPSPLVIGIHQMSESNEAQLVRMNAVNFTASGTFSGNTNYTITDGSQTAIVRIGNGSPLVGQAIPTGIISIVGISSQYCTSPDSGCTTGYQLLPRDVNDLVINSSIQITSSITQNNISTSGFDLEWTTNISGSSMVKYGLTKNLELGFANGVGGSVNHSVSLTGLIHGTIYYARVYSVSGNDTAISGLKVFATQSMSSGDIKVYFNSPVNHLVSSGTNAIQLFHAIDDTLIAYIDRAKYTLDLTIYDFNNTGISDISTAINNAYTRGVKVRFISDGSLQPTNSGVSDLNPAIQKIQSPTGGPYGIMHNKFVVIDAHSADPNDPVVWTGATNWQKEQIDDDPNNVIIFQDQSLARAYTLEFEEMWGDTGVFANLVNSRFGPDKTDNTPHEFNIGGKKVECYFSPSDNVNSKIVSAIQSADTDLEFASMVITRADIASAIVNEVISGVNAFGVTNDAINTTQWATLVAGMGASKMRDYPDTVIMHHKYLIIDPSDVNSDPLVLTGSHNWSNNADQRNDENTVIVHDATIANLFHQEFVKLYTHSGGTGIDTTGNVGLEEQAENIPVGIYPNPAEEVLNIHRNDGKAIGTVMILDATGKIIKSTLFSGWNGSLPLQGMSAGMYILQYYTGTHAAYKTFIKR